MINEFAKEIYKNWTNIKFLEKNIGNNIITITNKIKNTSTDGPFIDSDIADFIYEISRPTYYSDDEIKEHVKIAIRYIKKGNPEIIFQILRNKII